MLRLELRLGLKYEKLKTFKTKNDPIVENLFDENEITFLSETWKEKFDPDVLLWDDGIFNSIQTKI